MYRAYFDFYLLLDIIKPFKVSLELMTKTGDSRTIIYNCM